jgi:hypothetical protein
MGQFLNQVREQGPDGGQLRRRVWGINNLQQTIDAFGRKSLIRQKFFQFRNGHFVFSILGGKIVFLLQPRSAAKRCWVHGDNRALPVFAEWVFIFPIKVPNWLFCLIWDDKDFKNMSTTT